MWAVLRHVLTDSPLYFFSESHSVHRPPPHMLTSYPFLLLRLTWSYVCRFPKPTNVRPRKTLAPHPHIPSLQSYDSHKAILTVLREQIPVFSNGDHRLAKWVTPSVSVLYAFSTALCQHVGLVNIKTFLNIYFQTFSPANATFVGSPLVSVLHLSFGIHGSHAAKDASAGRDKFIQSLALAMPSPKLIYI
jgi:hypothetical protein